MDQLVPFAVQVALFAGVAVIAAILVWWVDRWLADQCHRAVELAWQQHCDTAVNLATDDLTVCEHIWQVSQ